MVSGKGRLSVSGRKKAALPPRRATVPKMTLGMKGWNSPVILTSGAVMLPMRVNRLLMPIPVCLGVREGIGSLRVGFLKDSSGAPGRGQEDVTIPPDPVSFVWAGPRPSTYRMTVGYSSLV